MDLSLRNLATLRAPSEYGTEKPGKLKLKLQTFPDPVTHVAFSPDSRTLVVSDQNGITLIFMLLPLDELIDLALTRDTPPMTPSSAWNTSTRRPARCTITGLTRTIHSS